MSNLDCSSETRSRIIVQGLPFDGNSSFKTGAADAPQKIRDALFNGSSNLWSESGIDIGANHVLFDIGDLNINHEADVYGGIQKCVDRALKNRSKLLFLGGDHSITYPIVKSISRHYPRLSILHLDAHPDLYDEYEGNKNSHASPFARIMEEGLVEQLVQVGIRTLNSHQREQAERFGVEIIEMKDCHSRRVLEFSTPLYISFDMDCLDPGFAPGVSHWEPGGLSTRQAIDIIQSLSADIVGADIVEFNPSVETGLTAMVAAKIFKEIAGKMVENDFVKAVTLPG